jgi:hypothetical protein
MSRPGLIHRSYAAAAVSGPASRPVATNQPTPQFQQHHDVERPQVNSTAFRQGWRVRTRLDGLLEAGRIDREAWDAACMWRRWVERTGSLPAQAWDVRVDRSLVPNDAAALARVQTAAKLRGVADALGPLRNRLLEFAIRDDRSWRQIGDRLGIDGKAAQAWVANAIITLAAFLAGKPVPDPPQRRPRIQPGSW